MDIITILNICMGIAVALIVILVLVYFGIVIKNRKKEKKSVTEKQTENKKERKDKKESLDGVKKESIFNFIDFDDIKDNMIIRKNRKQYVMVIECKGVNYDLMSEEEKISVEEGFTQFLNTLRFPIQLYVQTSSLNLRDTIDQYKDRLNNMQKELNKLDIERNKAKIQKDENKYSKICFEIRKKENVLEYTTDICEYIESLSKNKNVLQQKPYVIVSYYPAELGDIENFSQDEIDGLSFSEIYTRAQTVMRTLASSGVMGRILNSSELAELLYLAYNREDAEYMRLSKVIDAQYDSLYSTGKDILKKREEQLEEQIEKESLDLATSSISIADIKLRKRKEKKKETVKEKALDIIDEYKDQMSDDLYEQTKKEILERSKEEPENSEDVKKKKTKEN